MQALPAAWIRKHLIFQLQRAQALANALGLEHLGGRAKGKHQHLMLRRKIGRAHV